MSSMAAAPGGAAATFEERGTRKATASFEVPIDAAAAAGERQDMGEEFLVAFSLHGLGPETSRTSSSSVASASNNAGNSISTRRWGILASDGGGGGGGGGTQAASKEARKSWLHSFNTAVGGGSDRQDNVTLMLTLTACEESSTTTAAAPSAAAAAASTTPSGVSGAPSQRMMPRRSISGERSQPGAASVGSLSSNRSADSTVVYQSEQRVFGQPAPAPGIFPGGEEEEGMGVNGKQRLMTMAEEGVVHFSVPARVSGKFRGGVVQNVAVDEGVGGGEGGGTVPGVTAVVFVVELWHVANRARRVLLGSLPLSWDQLASAPTDPRKCDVFRGLESERYPSAILAVRRISSPLPRPLSLSPTGATNPSFEKFNPMVTFFTTIRRTADAGQKADGAPGSMEEAQRGGYFSADVGGGSGVGGGSTPPSSSAKGWELVVCQELAAEGRFTFQLPLQFLSPVHKSLKEATLAWRLRALSERRRQGLFQTDEEAFASGMVLVRVSVSRARGLDTIAAAAAAAAAAGTGPGSPSSEPSDQLLLSLGDGAGGGVGGGSVVGARPPNPETELQRQIAAERDASLGVGGGGDAGGGGSGRGFSLPGSGGGGSGGGGRGLGALGGLGIEGAKVSSSMRKFGGRMKGMGVKAVAMARIASQASPAAHIRLGAVSTEEKILRQANFFVKVVYEPASAGSLLGEEVDDDIDGVGGGGVGGGGGWKCEVDGVSSGGSFSKTLEGERLVGVTNTEYGSVAPVWGTNANRAACPYNAPRLQHQVSGATRLKVVNDVNAVDVGDRELPAAQGSQDSLASSSSLAFSFYVPAKDLERQGGASLRLHLYQNTFSLKAGIVDAPVGSVRIPLSEGASSTVRAPEWKELEGYQGLPVVGSDGGFGMGGDMVSSEGKQEGPPRVLVGVSVQSRKAVSPSKRGSSDRPPVLLDDASWAYGSGALGDGGAVKGVSAGQLAAGATRHSSLGAGEWTKVEDDSDSDEEVVDEGAAAAAAASTTSTNHHLSGYSENLLGKALSIHDCYRWMDVIGEPGRVPGKSSLFDLFALVDYPVDWVESHARGISNHVERLGRMLDVYNQRFSEGANFRSSLLKKEPLLQYVATNLHIQVWSIRDPVTGRDRSYDFVTTGAPAAHTLGHAGGGLVTLEAKLQEQGAKVARLRDVREECKDQGGVLAVTNLEGHTENLRAALLEFEVLSGRVSIRRACVISQAVSIATTSFCAKLEMMARGTLDIATDVTTGGCDGYGALAERWVTTGFLLGFEGLLSIHGKEHGMVEDTVSALDMLAEYSLKVVPASPLGRSAGACPGSQSTAHNAQEGDFDFELEVAVEGKTIHFIVGDSSLTRLPRALWDNDHCTHGNGGDEQAVRIIPVLFTQGIDIQQSMTHASRDAREKAAFQADINSQNLVKLNQYCHRVSPVKTLPVGTATAMNAAASSCTDIGRENNASAMSPSSMPPLPNLKAHGGKFVIEGGVDDLLGLGDVGISGGSTEGMYGSPLKGGGGDDVRAIGAVAGESLHEVPSCRNRTSESEGVPRWTHPALVELETAVKDDKIAHKNTAILLEAQVAVRRLCGGRVTFCKSGKDRTAMSVTLEEALLLAETTSENGFLLSGGSSGATGPGMVAAGSPSREGWRAAERSGALADANVLREHGCRLLVAEKNIGRPLYSFNALQRQFIPELYQPPPQTIQDVITSALNRDS